MRFFGKIHGTEKDYYIVETTVPEGEEAGGDTTPDVEAKGTGVNVYTYYVTHDSMSEWVQLPDLTPKELAASR